MYIDACIGRKATGIHVHDAVAIGTVTEGGGRAGLALTLFWIRGMSTQQS